MGQTVEQGLYTLAIRRQGDRYEGTFSRGIQNRSLELAGLAPGARPFEGRSDTLESVLSHLLTMDGIFIEEFNERFQLELGRYLYRETFERAGWVDLPVEGDVEVRILTADEHIARLPWVLLARDGHFLSAAGWSVYLGLPGAREEDAFLPPSPNLLIVAPQPSDQPQTKAAQHIDELEKLLSAADRYFQRGEHLRVVETWEELLRVLPGFKPDLLYFYGHGKGTFESSRLLFPSPDGSTWEIPVADLAQALREAGQDQLALAYINCCQGDTGGLLGAGRQMGEVAAAVVTNRTVATVSAAQAQAQEFWEALLIRGEPPHRAVIGMYSRLANLGLTLRDVRWMTPVLHRRYGVWRSSPPRSRDLTERDPNWRVKLDRLKQVGQVFLEARDMLYQRRPRALAYFWYGEEGQGIELFHDRLRVELLKMSAEISFYQADPDWPDESLERFRSFEDMMSAAFHVQNLEDVPGRIRGWTRSDSRRPALVYVCHRPLRSGGSVHPAEMGDYLEWWDRVFAARLEEAGAYGLLGVSFVTNNQAKVQEFLSTSFEDLHLVRMAFHVLDEMEKVALSDLVHFLNIHGVSLPRDRSGSILQEILTQTGGRYEMTLEALKDLLDRPWDIATSRRARRRERPTDENW
jgi:hypothetical protein